MVVHKIATVDVTADTRHAFASMLSVIASRANCRWEIVNDPGIADVILTQFDATGVDTGAWRSANKHFIGIISANKVRPLMRHTLVHPFRHADVESVLNEIAGGIENQRCGEGAADQATDSVWIFPRALLVLSQSAQSDQWYCARNRFGDLVWISGDLNNYLCEPAFIEQLYSGDARLESLVAIGARNLPQRLVHRPAFELFWLATFHASENLAPWLAEDSLFQLRPWPGRWPDFGIVRVSRPVIQTVAWLAARSCTRDELASLVEASPRLINRVLNALSVCHLLVVNAPVAGRASAQSKGAAGIIRSLVSGLRKRLGFVG